MKKALRKYVLQHGTADWPSQLPTIEFGYRTSPQRSTGYNPYCLIYGREPTYPAQVRALLDGQAVDVEDLDAMYELITQRAQAPRDAMPVAYEGASIAQFKQGCDSGRYGNPICRLAATVSALETMCMSPSAPSTHWM